MPGFFLHFAVPAHRFPGVSIVQACWKSGCVRRVGC